MKWFLLISGLMILLFIYMFVQALLYKTRYYTLHTKAGIRFLHLTDIHIRLLYTSSARIKKTIEKAQPDYLIIGGDVLDRPTDLKKFIRWFRELNLQIPAYAVFGNHEYSCFLRYPGFKKEFLSAMKQLNIRVLVNEVILLQPKNSPNQSQTPKPVALVGMDDYKTGMTVNNALFKGLRQNSACTLAFSHNPDISLHIPEGSVDLLILGHFHGGQMWIPFNLEYILLRKDRVSRMGHIKGFSTIRKNLVYISRGLGTVLFPFRFFSVPEVTVIDV